MGGHSSSIQKDNVKRQISTHAILMYSTADCTYCVKAKKAFNSLKVTPKIISVDTDPNGDDIASALIQLTKNHTFPYIFIAGNFIGGYNDMVKELKNGTLQNKFRNANVLFEEFSV